MNKPVANSFPIPQGTTTSKTNKGFTPTPSLALLLSFSVNFLK